MLDVTLCITCSPLVASSLTKQSVNVSECHSRHQCKPLITMAFGYATAPADIAGAPRSSVCARSGSSPCPDLAPNMGRFKAQRLPDFESVVVNPKPARHIMSHDQLVAIITTMLVAGKLEVTTGTTASDTTLKEWVKVASAIVQAAAGTSGPKLV